MSIEETKQVFSDANELHDAVNQAIEKFKKKHPGRRVNINNGHGTLNIISGVTFNVCFDGKETKST